MHIDDKLSKEQNLENARKIQEKAKDLIKRHEDIIREAKQLSPTFGYNKREYTKNNEPQKIMSRINNLVHAEFDLKSTYDMRELSQKEKDEKIEKEKKMQEAAKQKQEYLNNAIKYCLENNLVFGKDFATENATQVAEDMAFNKEVEKRIKDNSGGYFEFNGQNCDGPCRGWDGVSHRCDCGNRRVYWQSDGGFKDIYIYGEAY